jgi:hypothetical protein
MIVVNFNARYRYVTGNKGMDRIDGRQGADGTATIPFEVKAAPSFRRNCCWIDMKTGSWITIAVLLALFVAAIWLGYEGWTMDQGVQMSTHGYIAMTLGIFFGIGLMALIFYSSRAGYDDPPHLIGKHQNPGEE